eukprot:3504285-Pyramimonas_sp.AAC.2
MADVTDSWSRRCAGPFLSARGETAYRPMPLALHGRLAGRPAQEEEWRDGGGGSRSSWTCPRLGPAAVLHLFHCSDLL